MKPTQFEAANSKFGPPPSMSEQQVGTVPACHAVLKNGALDGMPVVITAWKPDERDLKHLAEGKPVFLMVFGGLPPHAMATRFEDLGALEVRTGNIQRRTINNERPNNAAPENPS